MKLEANKIYVSKNGYKYEYVGHIVEPRVRQRVFLKLFDRGGLDTVWDTDLHFYDFKEHTPPRHDKEIVVDLVGACKNGFVNSNHRRDLLKEATQMLERWRDEK